jgi:hypothetical protein
LLAAFVCLLKFPCAQWSNSPPWPWSLILGSRIIHCRRTGIRRLVIASLMLECWSLSLQLFYRVRFTDEKYRCCISGMPPSCHQILKSADLKTTRPTENFIFRAIYKVVSGRTCREKAILAHRNRYILHGQRIWPVVSHGPKFMTMRLDLP